MIKLYLLLDSDSQLTWVKEYNKIKLQDCLVSYCFRGTGYYGNKKFYTNLSEIYLKGKPMGVDSDNNPVVYKGDIVVITNDEHMLEYVDLFNGREYGIDLFLQDTTKEELTFINVLETYPNVRRSNNVMKMALSGIFGGIKGE